MNFNSQSDATISSSHVGTQANQHLEPLCEGCGYDLRGLPDGNCPECGHSFELDALFRLHRERLIARARKVQLRWRSTWNAILFFGLCYLFVGAAVDAISFSSRSTAAVFCSVWLTLLMLWVFRVNPDWRRSSYELVWFAVPLLVFVLITARSEHPTALLAILIVLLGTLCVAALTYSPRKSVLRIGLLVILPSLLAGGTICVHAFQRQGGWSELNTFASGTWKAMPASVAMNLGLCVLGIAIGFAVSVLLLATLLRVTLGLHGRRG